MRQEYSNITLLGLGLIVICGLLILLLPRRYATIGLILGTCFVTLGQQVVVFGLNFHAIRILVLCGLLRIVFRRELKGVTLAKVDAVLLIWISVSTLVFVGHRASGDAVVAASGRLFNNLGCYMLFRALIRSIEEAQTLYRATAIVLAPLAILMILEKVSGTNPFSVFGGVERLSVSRSGSVRAQGPFRHPILAGTFAATLLPVLVSLWWGNRYGRILSLIGIGSASAIVIASHSGGPLTTFFLTAMVTACWCLRRHIRALWWTLLLGVLVLHLLMKAPVWYLLARMSNIVGGTGWHRAELITQAIKHFDEWWLFGTVRTAHWMPYSLTSDPLSADITNQFISEGIGGGLASMGLFILLIVVCFRSVSVALRYSGELSFAEGFVIWTYGVSLFAHVVSFFSVSYFDQNFVYWNLLLANVAMLSKYYPRRGQNA